MSTLKILVEARKLLEAGWCKYKYIDYTHLGVSYCALGALGQAADNIYPDDFVLSLRRDAEAELAKHVPLDGIVGRKVPAYNDHFKTTHKDILTLFDKAIESTTNVNQ